MKKYIIYLPNGNSLIVEAAEHAISTKSNFIFFYDTDRHTVAIFATANIAGFMIDNSL